MTYNFQGVDTDFKDIFYTYAVDREGYRTKVYPDIYKNPTVGVGHLVTTTDNLKIGDIISKDRVQQLFDQDYDSLNIDYYVNEGASNYNQALAIAHFIWGHGESDYANSQLRQHVINGDEDLAGMQSYLLSNWDKTSPTNEKVNKYDFNVYFSDTPWTPSKSMAYYFSQIQNITDQAIANPLVPIIIIAGISAGIYAYIHFVIKNKEI